LSVFKPLILSWIFSRIILHLFLGIILALLFVRNGIYNSSIASQLFVWWNNHLCNIFKTQIHVQGKINQDACLYVINHISWFDIPVLASQQPVHFLSKAEVQDWPLIGWLVQKVGTLFIQRGANGAAQKSLGEITHCLLQGNSVAIFPEGTTTDGTGLRKFHGRLLQAAIDARVKIQPIALRYPLLDGINPHVPYIDDISFLGSVSNLIGAMPLNAELHYLPAIDSHLNSSADISTRELAQLCRQAIAGALDIEID